ncbi:hypothetical protein ANTHELSMS3_01461 [Antarctobacter heliothermus]|uniref:Uncharacterized protein n=1 Tax=Antarctobacter heliothermus TaxID=74033 RepID=A0A222E1Q3_9RHOB|nr:hypothetical protein ANTHELSMS3_01461 [Antarctobacter heliothermus]
MLVVLDDFLNDKVQEFLGEFRVEIGLECQILEPRDLIVFARGVGWGKVVLRLENAHGLSVLEPLCERENEDRVETVDRLAVFLEQVGSAGNGVSQWPSLSV